MSFGEEIHQIEPGRGGEIDEQQWPINVALTLLAAFVVGVVAAVSDFDDPRLLYNGWARLIGVGLTMGALLAAMTWLRQRLLRRIQLGVLLSLLFHLGLAFYLHQQYLRILAEEEAQRTRQERTAPRELVAMPEYNWEHVEHPAAQQDFEEPVPTEELVDTEPDSPQRSDVDHSLPVEKKPEPQQVERARQQPSPTELRRAELSAPHRAEQAAGRQVSRQPWKQRPVPNEPVPRPTIRPAPEVSDRASGERVAAVERRATDARLFQRRTFDQPSSEQRVEQVALARRANAKPPIPDKPTAPTPARRLARAAAEPQPNATAPEPVRRASRSQASLEATERVAARRAENAARPAAQKRPVEPSPETTAEVTRSTAPHRRPDRRPELARRPQTEPTRRLRPATLAAESARPEA
ncbi:MAG: hypothetical protein ACOC46_03520, partial [Pirellulales bacterium]